MSLVFTGHATAITDVSPILTGAVIMAVLATAPQNMTYAQIITLRSMRQALPSVSPSATIISQLTATTHSTTLTGYAIPIVDVSPIYTAASIAVIFAIAPENWTGAQLGWMRNACLEKAGGEEPAAIMGTLFP